MGTNLTTNKSPPGFNHMCLLLEQWQDVHVRAMVISRRGQMGSST